MNDEIKDLEQNIIEVNETYQLKFNSISIRVCLSTTKIDYIQELGFGVVLDRTDSFSRVVPLVFISSDDAKKFRDEYYNKIRLKNGGFINNPYQLNVICIKENRKLYKIHSDIDVFITEANYKYIQPKMDKIKTQPQHAIKTRNTLLSYQDWIKNMNNELIKYGWAVDFKEITDYHNKSYYRISITDRDKFKIPLIFYNVPGSSRVRIESPQNIYYWEDFILVDKLRGEMTLLNEKTQDEIITTQTIPIFEKVYRVLLSNYSKQISFHSEDHVLHITNGEINFRYTPNRDFVWDEIIKCDIYFGFAPRLKTWYCSFYPDFNFLLTYYIYLNYNKSLVFNFQKDGYKPIIEFLNYIITLDHKNIIKEVINKNLINFVEISKDILKTIPQS